MKRYGRERVGEENRFQSRLLNLLCIFHRRLFPSTSELADPIGLVVKELSVNQPN